MAWIHLLVAAVFEVVFALATNATHGSVSYTHL